MASGAIYLSIDYGLKRIGMAVGDDLTGLARPLPALANGRQPDWQALAKALQDWRPRAVIIGLPVALDGSDQPITLQTRNFAQALRSRFGVPVHLCDERLSSRAADDEIRSARADGRKTHRTRKGERDGVAARIILEQWLGSDASRTTRAAAAPGTAIEPECGPASGPMMNKAPK